MAAASLRAASIPTLRAPEAIPDELLEACVPGEQIETSAGRHYRTGRFYERWRHHGGISISDLWDLPDDLLSGISAGELPPAPVDSWAFLDTETTGLAGGSGTCAFLIGVGRITDDGFRVRQYFMRDYNEEASQLEALEEDLSDARLLITYNGKAFDLPLLETRFRMTRRRSFLSTIPHLDLLHGARRLWRLRFESCRLVELESQVLGYCREGDVPGHLIPLLYFEYVRTRLALRIAPVFLHNALDILTLACLTAVVPHAFRDPGQAPIRHPSEMVALGRWLRAAGQLDQALLLFRRAVEARSLRDDLMHRTLWDIAAIEKKQGRPEALLPILTELAATNNPHCVTALEELAKHYEHKERNYAMALEMTEAALQRQPNDALLHRQTRLKKRAAAARLL